MDADREYKDCLVIMPISDYYSGYTEGHFKTVYDRFIKPSILHAGLSPVKYDGLFKENIDYVEVVSKIVKSPLVLFDLSSRNHQIITALRIRRAFHYKASIIIKDDRTPENDDIRIAKYLEYPQNIKSGNFSLMQLMLTKLILHTIEISTEKDN